MKKKVTETESTNNLGIRSEGKEKGNINGSLGPRNQKDANACVETKKIMVLTDGCLCSLHLESF